jgi:hypothetical protein
MEMSSSKSTKVRSIIVDYFIYMRLNVNGSFDIKKTQKLPNLSLNSFLQNQIFSFFVKKNGPINVESHIYKVTTIKSQAVACLV